MRLPWNWRDRIEIVTDDDDTKEIVFYLQFKEGRTPPGFCRQIGELCVSQSQNCWIVDGSQVEERFQRKGLGKMLYLHAMKHCGSLTTLYHHASEEAKRVWKSIKKNRKHKADFWSGRLTVYHRKPMKVSK